MIASIPSRRSLISILYNSIFTIIVIIIIIIINNIIIIIISCKLLHEEEFKLLLE